MVLALGARSAIGAFGYAHSIPGFGFAAASGLSGGYAVLIFVGGRGLARIRIHGSGTLTVTANGFTTRVLGTVLRNQTRSKKHTRHHQQNFHLHRRFTVCVLLKRTRMCVLVILAKHTVHMDVFLAIRSMGFNPNASRSTTPFCGPAATTEQITLSTAADWHSGRWA
jgi:hypothetical protein